MLKEFKEFAFKGNMIDMAVGIIIGAAFSAIVSSLVSDIIMPPIGLIWKHDFTNLFIVLKDGIAPGPYATLADAKKAAAVTLNYGVFVNFFINFLIVALSIFILISYINRLRRPKEAPAAPATKECPYCLSTIPLNARRCAHCTSTL